MTIEEVKQELSQKIGQTVTLTAYEPRNIIIERIGVLSKVFPSLFVIDIDRELAPKSADRVSYNYADILTGYIELEFN